MSDRITVPYTRTDDTVMVYSQLDYEEFTDLYSLMEHANSGIIEIKRQLNQEKQRREDAEKDFWRMEKMFKDIFADFTKEKQRREDAEKIINLLHEKEESTTLKSECWIMAVNYKDKYNESEVVK